LVFEQVIKSVNGHVPAIKVLLQVNETLPIITEEPTVVPNHNQHIKKDQHHYYTVLVMPCQQSLHQGYYKRVMVASGLENGLFVSIVHWASSNKWPFCLPFWSKKSHDE
jgi:hypothetical protein